MRNLRNIRFSTWKPPKLVTAACWDAAKDNVILALGPTSSSNEIRIFRLSESDDGTTLARQIASWDAPSPAPDVSFDRIIDIHHLSDLLITCIVLEGGDIYIVREDEDAADTLHHDEPVLSHVEIVGSVDAGISAAKWAPDEELLVLASKANALVMMSRNFDSVAESTMTGNDLKASRHVSVGWGKKETQFRGKGAKALRDPTIPEKVEEGALSPLDDGRTTISWRGDGAYVAINSIEEGKRRVIRVYSREGTLDSVSEPVDNLEGALSWRPAGNLIAGIKRLQERTEVVFFERNGLRHGQFSLRSPEQAKLARECPRLEWSVDSSVLAVVYCRTVQLWAMGNYHWYLKQEITNVFATTLTWHPEKPLRFALGGEDRVLLLEYVFSVARGSTESPTDHGAVGVIDGKELKLYAMRTANIPPPLSQIEIEAPSSIRDVAFSSDNKFMAVLHNTGINLYQWQTNSAGRTIAPRLLSSTKHSNQTLLAASEAFQPIQIGVSSNGVVTFGAVIFETPELLSYHIVDTNILAWTGLRKQLDSAQILLMGADSTYALSNKRSVTKIEGLAAVASITPFPSFLPWVEFRKAPNGSLANVGLSRNGVLYADGATLAKNCTSFVTTPDHIIFTTNNHLVKFVHFTNGSEYEAPSDDPETDERCRSIERGGRLVTAIPSKMSIILQMPRGNLETIYPRAMVLAGIRQSITAKDYKSAFIYCQTHRVDLNILYDANPTQFLANVELFIDQLGQATSIDLFLSSLKEEDVTQTMYRDTKTSSGPVNVVKDNINPQCELEKVNTVCNAVLKVLGNRPSTNLQNIITANVSKMPPAIDDGLLVVAGLMKHDAATAERAAEHICFLVDVNHLYDHALGLYDLDLALLVAQQSQRDPREYVPFIQSLHDLPEQRRKYTIDDHLGRRAKALNHLQAMNVFEETKSYVVKHCLYKQALDLYRYDVARRSEVVRLYAKYLETSSKHHQAGLAYESLQEYLKASSCYRVAGPGSWRECLYALQRHQDQVRIRSGDNAQKTSLEEALIETATALAEALNESKDHASAAEIYQSYLGSPEQAIRSFCKGYHFSQALQLCTQQRPFRHELLETVDAGLAEATSSSTDFLAECKAQLSAQVPRILELRERARADPLAFYEGELPGGSGGDLPDDVSVAASSHLSTSASLFTRYTGKGGVGSVGTVGTGVSRATAKNRRREEKKRARGRKGTVYEEEYLVNSVRRLVERVEGTARSETHRLVEALARRGMNEWARAVETLAIEVTEGCIKAVREVWGADDAQQDVRSKESEHDAGGSVTGEESWVARGGDAVLREMLEDRARKQVPPNVKKFEKLDLVG